MDYHQQFTNAYKEWAYLNKDRIRIITLMLNCMLINDGFHANIADKQAKDKIQAVKPDERHYFSLAIILMDLCLSKIYKKYDSKATLNTENIIKLAHCLEVAFDIPFYIIDIYDETLTKQHTYDTAVIYKALRGFTYYKTPIQQFKHLDKNTMNDHKMSETFFFRHLFDCQMSGSYLYDSCDRFVNDYIGDNLIFKKPRLGEIHEPIKWIKPLKFSEISIIGYSMSESSFISSVYIQDSPNDNNIKSYVVKKYKHVSGFVREISALNMIKHTNLISAVEIDFTGYMIKFERMQFTLQHCIKHFRESVLKQNTICEFIISKIVDGIEHLHQLGIIHRDIKPDNIMINFNGIEPKNIDKVIEDITTSIIDVKIIDFGNSIYIDKYRGTWTTPTYAPPEQFTNFEVQTNASDIWSLGCTVWEMKHGRPPFKGVIPFSLFANQLDQLCADPCKYIGGSEKETFQAFNEDMQQCTVIEHDIIQDAISKYEKMFNSIFKLDPTKRPSIFQIKRKYMKN